MKSDLVPCSFTEDRKDYEIFKKMVKARGETVKEHLAGYINLQTGITWVLTKNSNSKLLTKTSGIWSEILKSTIMSCDKSNHLSAAEEPGTS